MATVDTPPSDTTSSSARDAAADLEGLSEKPKSFGQLAWERFRNHKLAMIGAIGLILIIIAFNLAPWFSDYPFDERNVRDRLLGPSMDHPFGTDELGRDLFVRTARGARYSMLIGLTAALLSTVIGTVLGALAGFFGKALDALISQVINLVLFVPFLITLSVVALKFGTTWWKLTLVLSSLLWVRIARIVRGLVLQIKEQEFVMAARAAGAKSPRIIFRHILPNVIGAVAVEITLLLGAIIVLESTLSFLGFGVKPPETSLGLLVADAKGNVASDPIRVLMPGFIIVLIVLCVNFLGDGLRDALDPKTGRD